MKPVRLELPAVYPLTDTALARMPHAAIAAELWRAGARIVQIRDKHLAAGALCAAVREARRLAAGVCLIVNDRLDVALAGGADGVHLGNRNLPAAQARRLAGPAFVIGVSTHSVEQALEAQAEPCDYVALGPIFPTANKPDARPALGLEAIRRVADLKTKPLVAIGGIGSDSVASVLEAGADSAAVIGAVMVPGAVAGRMREMLAAARA